MEKKKGKFPPLPFIGSVYTRARHRVISLFLSQAGVQGSGTLLSPGLAFAPPFVFIRGSRGTLTATCRLPNPPFHPRSRFHRDRGPRRAASFPLGGGREGRGPKEGWKKELREKRLSFERGEGKKWHACHTSRFPWLRYFLATRIYYSHPTPDSFSLSRLSTLLLPKSGRHNFALVKLEAGSSYVVSSLSLSFLSRWKWKEGFNNRCEFTVYEDDGNRNSNERGREGGISFEQQRFVGQLIIKLLWVITY